MRGGREGKGRTREDWYRPRVQGHECEGYRTSLPPNAERIYRVPCDDALAFPRSAEAGGGEAERRIKHRGGRKENVGEKKRERERKEEM